MHNRMQSNFKKSEAEKGLTLIELVFIAVLVMVGSFIATLIGIKVGQKQPPTTPQSATVYNCAFMVSPPSTLEKDFTVKYRVQSRSAKVSVDGGVMTVLTTSKIWGAVKDAEVTFSIKDGYAVLEGGGLTKTVKTDTAGIASVILKPAKTGDDELNVHVKVGKVEGDEDPPAEFEVIKK